MDPSAEASGGSYIYRASKAAVSQPRPQPRRPTSKSEGIAVGLFHPGWVRTAMGGAGATLDATAAAEALAAQIERLDLASSGSFRGWNGRDIPF